MAAQTRAPPRMTAAYVDQVHLGFFLKLVSSFSEHPRCESAKVVLSGVLLSLSLSHPANHVNLCYRNAHVLYCSDGIGVRVSLNVCYNTILRTKDYFEGKISPPHPRANFVHGWQMMTQRRADELYQNELAKYNEDNSMLTHAAQNERRWATQKYVQAMRNGPALRSVVISTLRVCDLA